MTNTEFGKFLKSLKAVIPIHDYPAAGTEESRAFWAPVQQAFADRAVFRPLADAAAEVLALGPQLFLGQVRHRLLEECDRLRDQFAPPDAVREGSYQAALDASRDCPDCGGQPPATARRYVHNRANPQFGYGYAFRCDCPLGRWHHAANDQLPEAARVNLAALADHPELLLGPVTWSDAPDNRFRYPPGQWDEAAGRPIALDARQASFAAARLRRRSSPSAPLTGPPPPMPRPGAYHHADVDRLYAYAAAKAADAQPKADETS